MTKQRGFYQGELNKIERGKKDKARWQIGSAK